MQQMHLASGRSKLRLSETAHSTSSMGPVTVWYPRDPPKNRLLARMSFVRREEDPLTTSGRGRSGLDVKLSAMLSSVGGSVDMAISLTFESPR